MYAIWGKPPGYSEETLLVAMPHGKPIQNKQHALRLARELTDTHHCQDVRIQEIRPEDLRAFGVTVQ